MEDKNHKESADATNKKQVTKKRVTNPKVEIEIKRHQQLFNLLSDPKRMWRVLLSLLLVIVIIFLGIAFVIIAIKKYYPYNVIETNLEGATIMKSEDKEVIYWLFNTADLWANSGIEVQEGDVLTIRASGASHTAIHHLVDASKNNFVSDDQWVGTEGQKKNNIRDLLRAEYRINKNYDEGILLMRVVPTEDSTDLSKKYVEVIGKERRDLRISKSGVLHFAVNDIVLTDDVLDSMYCQFIDSIKENFKNHQDILEKAKSEFKNIGNQNNTHIEGFKTWNKQLLSGKDSTAIIDFAHTKGLSLGEYHNHPESYPLMNELVYYKQKQFRDAWYVDNLGSFLIVIERKR